MRQKVLIIDDSRLITALVQARLADEPIDLSIATNGEDGMAMARQLQPDLILLDVEMPQPDGFAVCRELKSKPETMHIPIVFLTGVSSTEEKIKGLDLGAVDYITKPFEPAELRARVRASLRTKYLVDLLAKKAQIDGLSGLWNRTYFDHRLSSEFSLARRTGNPLSCMMIDIDHFKHVNDEHGHPAGDEVIRQVAQRISDSVRNEEVVCRYGGEEFSLILPNTPADKVLILAERLRQKLAETPMGLPGSLLNVTASFGIADAFGDPMQSVERADSALYTAKRNGRNRVEIVAVKSAEPSPTHTEAA